MVANMIDAAIATVSPNLALQRAKARTQLRFLRSSGAYEGAGHRKPWARNWFTRKMNSDIADLGDREKLAERSSDLYRNAPLATSALGTLETNVVGSGLQLQSQIDHDFLSLSQEKAEKWQENTERLWRAWANSHLCDTSMSSTFGQLQNIAFHATLLHGDVIALFPILKRNKKKRITVKLLESAHLSNPDDAIDSENIAAGVEIDQNGTPVAFHIAKHHPFGLYSGQNEWKKIKLFTKYRQNALLLFDKKLPGQRRGVPILAPVIESLKQLTRYHEAEITAAVVNGMFSVFIKQEPQYDEDGNQLGINELEGSIELGAGSISYLEPGESIEIADAKRPNTAFEPFTLALSRYISSALQLPYEVVVKHFTASYSASRGALLEAWKFFKVRRDWLADNFCQVIYREWLTFEIANGRIEAPGYFESEEIRFAYQQALWNGAGQGQLNPLQETKAAVMKIDHALSTGRRETAAMNGSDHDMNIKRCGVEKQKKIDAGIENQNEEGQA